MQKDDFNFKSKTFKDVMKKIGNKIADFTDRVLDGARWIHFMGKPIGIIMKNNPYIDATLKRNIGGTPFIMDGYGTPIGELADPYYNKVYGEAPLWYKDFFRKKSANYLEFANKLNENIIPYDFLNFDRNKVERVGVLRGFLKDEFPRSYDDSLIGKLGDVYLNRNLDDQDYHKVMIARQNMENESLTKLSYANFGNTGTFSIANGLGPKNGKVRSIKEYVGNLINFDEDLGDNVDRIARIKNDTNNYILSKYWNDAYISSLNEKQQLMVFKSMLGYDLLSNMDLKSMFSNPKNKYNNVIKIDNIKGIDNDSVETYLNKNIGNMTPFMITDDIARYDFHDRTNSNIRGNALYTYSEPEGSNKGNVIKGANTFNEGINKGIYNIYNSNNLDEDDLINYTNNLFTNGQLDTLIGRFHSNYIGLDEYKKNNDITSSAISRFGMSHGRNLLKSSADNPNGYDNPYCRVWTYHHQYSKLSDTIRPFDGTDADLKNTELSFYRTNDSFDKLKKYGVKGSNGLVQIAPTSKDNIKKCMFSIENLAWKDEKKAFENYKAEKGPLGGRIMWFPPYDLKFSENVNVEWNANKFIGRGESIYTYTNTERKGQLSFKLLIDHPSIINSYRKEDSYNSDVNNVDSTEQKLLRFFAGCDILQAKTPKTIKKEAPKPVETPPPPKPIKIPVSTFNEINFYVFFPNDYSGVDDSVTGQVPPMEYLMNGIGTNLYKGENGRISDYNVVPSKKMNGYEVGDKGISEIDGKMLGDEENANDTISNFTVLRGRNGRKWGYRVDKRVNHEILKKGNYSDRKSFKLNSDGYVKLTEVHTDAKNLQNKGTLYSFKDVFLALEPSYNHILASNGKEKEVVKLLDEYEVKKVEIIGFASSHGYGKSNSILGTNRANSVKSWLNKCKPSIFKKSIFTYNESKIGAKLSTSSVNDFLAKAWRCVRVRIKLCKEELIEKSAENDVSLDSNGSPIIEMSDGKLGVLDQNGNIVPKGVEDATNLNFSVNYREKTRSLNNMFGKEKTDLFKTKNESLLKSPDLSDYNKQFVSNMFNIETMGMLAQAQGRENENKNSKKEVEYEDYGYRNEYEFFSELEAKEPFLHDKLVGKIKYFDPAFHSITPEGFQSRLTFLHQCTRQGNTNGNSDGNSSLRTASNLSFGRPPICVLRIGDFYYTKIIIESLSISYDDTTWDLNDEGIGVMPMIADVNISFTFLGGSDISGPITRLQNALSFNHYGNTSLYDSRAEEIEYGENGKITNFKPKV